MKGDWHVIWGIIFIKTVSLVLSNPLKVEKGTEGINMNLDLGIVLVHHCKIYRKLSLIKSISSWRVLGIYVEICKVVTWLSNLLYKC